MSINLSKIIFHQNLSSINGCLNSCLSTKVVPLTLINMPNSFLNAYISGTEWRINLKPGCKFELVRCLKAIKIVKFWSYKDLKVKDGPLSPVRVPQWSKKCSKMVGGIVDDVQCRNGICTLKWARKWWGPF